jgi:hypothetical protein
VYGGLRFLSAARNARNSASVRLAFRKLHRAHAGKMLSIEFEPPRDSGTR